MTMTTYTYDERIVSDLHKDTYGFRPVSGWWTEWKESDEDGKQAIWDMLLESYDQTMAYEKRMQEEAIEAFEAADGVYRQCRKRRGRGGIHRQCRKRRGRRSVHR